MRYFNWQLKKTLFSAESILAFTFTLCCYIFSGMFIIGFDNDFMSDFVRIVSNSLPVLIFPMLACVPVAVSYITEYKSGYLNLVLCKVPLKRYIAGKLLTNAFVGGLVISLPAILYLFRILAKKGSAVGPHEQASWSIEFYPDLYENFPLLYSGILIGCIFLCGASFATLGLGIGAILKKKYLVVLVPEVYYVGVAALVQNMNLCRYLDPMTLYVLNSPVPLRLSIRLFYVITILAVGVVLFILGVRKNVE